VFALSVNLDLFLMILSPVSLTQLLQQPNDIYIYWIYRNYRMDCFQNGQKANHLGKNVTNTFLKEGNL